MMRHIGYAEIDNAAWSLLNKLKGFMRGINRGLVHGTELRVWGVPRGGIPAVMALQSAAHRSHAFFIKLVDKIEDADLIVDDLIDSGATMKRYTTHCATPFAVLFTKQIGSADERFFGAPLSPDEWVIFPWEGDESGSADDIPTRLLQFIGEDSKRGGLRETPARFLKAWREMTSGYGQDPKTILKCFEDGAESYDEMVLVKDIPVYSQCEHHLVPFFGKAHIAYIPNGKIVGLSKLSRLVDVFSRRLQVQERLTNQIADALLEHLAPLGIGVVIECRHLCMEARGIERAGTTTITSAMRGAMMEKPEARMELLMLIGRNGHG